MDPYQTGWRWGRLRRHHSATLKRQWWWYHQTTRLDFSSWINVWSLKPPEWGWTLPVIGKGLLVSIEIIQNEKNLRLINSNISDSYFWCPHCNAWLFRCLPQRQPIWILFGNDPFVRSKCRCWGKNSIFPNNRNETPFKVQRICKAHKLSEYSYQV